VLKDNYTKKKNIFQPYIVNTELYGLLGNFGTNKPEFQKVTKITRTQNYYTISFHYLLVI